MRPRAGSAEARARPEWKPHKRARVNITPLDAPSQRARAHSWRTMPRRRISKRVLLVSTPMIWVAACGRLELAAQSDITPGAFDAGDGAVRDSSGPGLDAADSSTKGAPPTRGPRMTECAKQACRQIMPSPTDAAEADDGSVFAGDLDKSFGKGGKVITDLPNYIETIRAVAVEHDGKIVVVGDADDTP